MKIQKYLKQSLTLLLSVYILFIPSFAQAKITSSSQEVEPNTLQHDYHFNIIRDTPRHIALDLKESIWNKWALGALVIGSGLIAGLHSVDSNVQKKFYPANRLGKAKDIFGTLGNPYVLGSTVLVSFGISRLVKSPKYKTTAETMLEAYALTEALTLGLKAAVRRTRPNGGNYSFPSGHSSGAFAVASVIQSLHGFKYGIPAYAVSTMVGLSRLDDNKHYLTDVLAGALLGSLVGFGTSKFHKKENQNLFVMPTITNNSATFSLLSSF